MGRRPTKNLHLPPGMRLKRGVRGRVYYYYDMGGKPRRWKTLGADFVEALRLYADYAEGERKALALITFRHAGERYMKQVLPTKAVETQRVNLSQIKRLYEFFDNPPAALDAIKPIHVRQYLDWRKSSPVAANREIALFSHIFNKAREWGATDASNPCAGVRKHKETGRDIYIDDRLYRRLWDAACIPLRNATDLAYLTGQRPSDVLKIDQRDLADGVIFVRQGKTNAQLRISIVGELAILLDKIEDQKNGRKIHSSRVIVDETGKALGKSALRFRFDSARDAAGIEKSDFQFRDLRAKAGTDKESSSDLRQAQALLGHVSASMTEHYVRKRGMKVTPTR